jgi:hypothetical protein
MGLGQEHGRVSQAPADRAQAQRRVQVRVVAHRPAVERLVGADIDGADRDRHSLHALDRALVGLVLLFLVGQAREALRFAAHEQEFAAEQADADRARLDRAERVLGHLDVGKQVDALPVERDGRLVAQA